MLRLQRTIVDRCDLHLDRICDVNDRLGEDMLLYRYNEEKTKAWLAGKVERLGRKLAELEAKQGRANQGSFVAGFTMSSKKEAGTPDAVGASSVDGAAERGVVVTESHRLAAVDFIQEYLDDNSAAQFRCVAVMSLCCSPRVPRPSLALPRSIFASRCERSTVVNDSETRG